MKVSIKVSTIPTLAKYFVAFTALGVVGCEYDCDSPSRLDGMWAVMSESITPFSEVTGTNVELYPKHLSFIEGWTEWDFDYVPSQRYFQLEIDGHPFNATFDQAPDRCNDFTLRIEGKWVSEESTHDFLWMGDLSYYGTHVSGEFSYDDSWSWTDPSSGEQVSGVYHLPAGHIQSSEI